MRALFLVLAFLPFYLSFSQTGLFEKADTYTRQDSLRGSITPERVWWDLRHYDLYVSADPEHRTIEGVNKISYEVLSASVDMQIDLQEPMQITKVLHEGKELTYRREGNVFFISLPPQKVGQVAAVEVYFEGTPRAAKMAPWDGGFSWTKDKNGKHFVATSNQGIGASLWWPCKDHMYDEPEDGMLLSLNVPKGLVAVGNGRLDKVEKQKDRTKTYIWKVTNPINNYGVNINIGDYISMDEVYKGEAGDLDVSYWVLSYNKEKAEEQFKEAPRTLEAFEYWFGPYPFYEDSYKLVEVPYLGMEHQSSVTYGNNYQNGYNGRNRTLFDWSGTGWGKKWDYIIVHETGHEWFANNITAKDIADLWIHESFTTYSETLFVEYFFGKEAADEYTRGLRRNLDNNAPLIGDYDVNSEGSKGIYWKGSNMLHTIRQVIADDTLWRDILRGLNKTFYHQTVTTEDVEHYISDKAGVNLAPVFDQYLRDIRIPVLEYYFRAGELYYRWTNCDARFDMPVKGTLAGKEVTLKPTAVWQSVKSEAEEFEGDSNFYVYYSEIL